MKSNAIPRHILNAAARSFRFQVLSELNFAFAESGLTEGTLAKRLGWSVRRVRSALGSWGELTLRDIGELAWAIDGFVLEFSVVRR